MKKKHKVLQTILALCIIIIPMITHAQWGDVSGTVTDQFGYGIPNVEVRFVNVHWGDVYLDTTDGSGNYMIDPINSVNDNLEGAVYPENFYLHQNFPNPFNPNTTIPITINQSGDVTVQVFNTQGKRVKTLFTGTLLPGEYYFNWNATGENGRGVSAGIYLYRLDTKNRIITKKMVLLDGQAGHIAVGSVIPDLRQGNQRLQNNQTEIGKLEDRELLQYNIFDVVISGQYIETHTQNDIALSGGTMVIDFPGVYNKLISHDFTSNYTLQELHSPYYLQGTVDVEEGVTLTIELDVNLWTLSGSKLRIYGTIHADGTSVSPFETRIWIGPEDNISPPPGSWQGINFKSTASETSTMKYCDIMGANKGIEFDDGPSSITITDCWVSYCNNGIWIDGTNLTLDYCRISWCNTRGIIVYPDGFLTVTHTNLNDNYIGISTSDSEEIHWNNFGGLQHIFLQNDYGVYVNAQNNWWDSPNPSNWGVYIENPEWANYDPWEPNLISGNGPRP